MTEPTEPTEPRPPAASDTPAKRQPRRRFLAGLVVGVASWVVVLAVRTLMDTTSHPLTASVPHTLGYLALAALVIGLLARRASLAGFVLGLMTPYLVELGFIALLWYVCRDNTCFAF